MTTDIAGEDATQNLKRQLTKRDQQIVFSPRRLVLVLTISVFVIEALVMVFLGFFPGLPPVYEFLLDAAILVVVLLPVLFFDLLRPLLHLINDYRLSQDQLHSYQEHLEQMVRERTDELFETTSRLEEENRERRRVEEALQESEYRFRQLFEQSEDAIILLNTSQYDIIDINPPVERLFGKKRPDILAGGLAALCDPQGYDQLAGAVQQIATDNTSVKIERLRCRIGLDEKRVLSFRGKKIALSGAEGIYTTFRDITTRVRLEEEAQEIQARLIHANRMTSLGMLVSSVAHEINNPNNYILINAGNLKQIWNEVGVILDGHYKSNGDFSVGRTTWSEARNFLPDVIEGIRNGARRISEIVDNLKDFARTDQGVREALADVNAVVRRSVSILDHHISRATRHFQLELAEGLPAVKGNRRQLEQVIINLIQNALQALPDQERGVRVITGSDPEHDEILIRVLDDGEGISPEVAARIMEPFFTTRLEQGGTGLGLAISATIVKEHGGSLDFSSTGGYGTSFTVRLPAARPSCN